ncbi:MAG: hypothetical protein N3A69_14075, partial [Leptospiraceae bacterium]|nr:hypothetical protein [Leptospiraceae bacterium]
MNIEFKKKSYTNNADKPLSIAGKIGLSIFFFFFAAMGGFFSVIIIKNGFDTITARYWTKTSAVVLSSEIGEYANS